MPSPALRKFAELVAKQPTCLEYLGAHETQRVVACDLRTNRVLRALLQAQTELPPLSLVGYVVMDMSIPSLAPSVVCALKGCASRVKGE